jgi:plastocyanin
MLAVSQMQMRKHLLPLCAVMGIFLTSSFTFAFRTHTAHAATPAKESAKVSIANFVFAPPEITIAPGESVTWTNDDGAPHGLEFHDGGPGTDLLLPGVSFSRRFDRPGTYDYNCSVHPYMTGRVVVRPQ